MHRIENPLLGAFREAVIEERRGAELAAVLAEIEKGGGYQIGGANRKTIPRGFEPDHPRADLLLHDGLFATWDHDMPKEASSEAFVKFCIAHLAVVAPVHAWLLELRAATAGI